jgi:hypothetical protein
MAFALLQVAECQLGEFMATEMEELGDLELMMIGFVSPVEYVSTLSLTQLRSLLDKFSSREFGGMEVELFEAIRDRERQLLRDSVSPIILNLDRDGTSGRE